MQSAKYNYIWL